MKKTEKDKSLEKWQGRLSTAKAQYSSELNKMRQRENMYYGSHEILGAKKNATTGRNITYELIESQVDSSIPQPKVTAIHAEDEEKARKIENLLRNEVRRIHITELNDRSERTVPIQGGDFFHVEWNPLAGYHCTLGDVEIDLRHPRQVIPQPGIYDLEQMDYVFVLVSKSKESIEEKYGITLDTDTEDAPEVRGGDDMTHTGVVTQNIVYYKHDKGTVGMFSWVGNQVLEDYPDYYARTAEVCTKCGRKRMGDVCVCGNKKFKEQAVQTVTLTEDITLSDGTVIPAVTQGEDAPVLNPDGSEQHDVNTGETIMMPTMHATELPTYKPRGFPIVERINIARSGSFLGVSDVDIITDQQQAINKYATKIQEKLMKGGSFVTLPDGLDVDKSDDELKIIRIQNPSQAQQISVINVQPNVNNDITMMGLHYDYAKSMTGITDAYQGKYDASAVSGSAKQFSANQAAGRMQSKREMKNQAYARLYRLIFEYLLAYADEPYPMTETETDGEQQYGHFDRMEFLKMDAAGELYWDDEFIFEVDPASNLASNRERLWDMIDVKYQANGFGPITDLSSQYRLWTLLKETNFPYAATMQKAIKEEMEKQELQQMQLQQMQGDMGVTQGDMV